MTETTYRRVKLLFTIFVCFATIQCRAVVLDFDMPVVAPGDQDAYGYHDAYLEDGFRLRPTSNSGSIIRFKPPNNLGVLLPDNGTVHFGVTYFSFVLLDRPDGALFNFSQIDLAHYSEWVVTSRVSLRGNKADGTSISAELPLASTFDPQFHTFQLDASWNDLRSVDFLTDGFAWDNIVATIVPEPGSCTFGYLGALILSSYLRRKNDDITK